MSPDGEKDPWDLSGLEGFGNCDHPQISNFEPLDRETHWDTLGHFGTPEDSGIEQSKWCDPSDKKLRNVIWFIFRLAPRLVLSSPSPPDLAPSVTGWVTRLPNIIGIIIIIIVIIIVIIIIMRITATYHHKIKESPISSSCESSRLHGS